MATIPKNNGFPVMQLVKNVINKLMQTPDIYPIKYYKKGKKASRNRNFLLL
ncbi:hypothetical protein [Ferruginibacter sp.]|uniref:hypothetical protein n=1 Tax=Ferruginibacter sp. TaxID=1940288 RepID=UPI00265A4AAD|nr:hypothetical protein [Ferruginibacter sp.]